MAPIALDKNEQRNVEIQIKKNVNPYKEQASGPKAYSKDTEEQGEAPAKASSTL